MGLAPGTRLRRIVDASFRVHRPPADGLLVSRMLADRLQLSRGDTVRVEVTEGRRPERDMLVAGLVDELMGGDVYVEAETLYDLLGESGTVSGAWLRVDASLQSSLYARLKRIPGVSSVLVKEVLVQGFNETIEESFLIALTSTLIIGAALVMAIVYNQTRVALSERGRELASLRVLGFERNEVAYILLGELALLILVAIPVGLVIGYGLCAYLAFQFDTDLYRVPLVLAIYDYAFAALIVIVSALFSAMLIWRNLGNLDMVAVLKTKE